MKRLTSLTVEGFRVFRDFQSLSLDADVVIFHGTNGCGKTSLLHALELSLTGSVQDLDAFGESFPQCLRHVKAEAAAKVVLNFIDDDGTAKEHVTHLNPDAKLQSGGGALSRPERQHFLERCYLSQARLARLLEIYQAVDKEKKESPLATFVRELLGLDVLENIAGGLQVIGDKRRVKSKIKQYADLEDQEKHLLSQEERLQSEIRSALEALSKNDKAKVSEEDGRGTDNSATVGSKGAITPQAQDSAVSMSDDELDLELTKLRVELSSVEQSEAVLASLAEGGPVLSLIELEAEIKERLSIQVALSKILRDHLLDVGIFLAPTIQSLQTEDEELSFDSGWERNRQAVDRKNTELRNRIAECTAWQSRLTLARTKGEELDKEWVALSELVSAEQTPDRAFGETLRLLLNHVHGDNCPVCDRNFSEISTGTLREHLDGKLRELERRQSLVADVIVLQGKRDDHRKTLSEMESKEEEARKGRSDSEATLQIGLQLLSRFDELATSRESWVSNNQKQRLAQSDIAKARNADIQRQNERKKLETIATRLGILSPNSALASGELSLKVKSDVQFKLNSLQEIQSKRVNARKGLEAIVDLRKKLEACKAEREGCKRAQARADRVIESARFIAKKANDQKRQIIERVFDQTMNGLWRELFERLVLSESFYPQLSPPEISRNRVETRLSAGREDKVAFQDLAAVLSSGNLNTAALSLFLALNLIEKPRHQVLVLDDPVQNMDDIHVVSLGALLKSIARQANRQLVIAIHERSLFDYLCIELGPSGEGESLIAVEMERLSDGDSAALSWEKTVWQPDGISFPIKATVG